MQAFTGKQMPHRVSNLAIPLVAFINERCVEQKTNHKSSIVEKVELIKIINDSVSLTNHKKKIKIDEKIVVDFVERLLTSSNKLQLEVKTFVTPLRDEILKQCNNKIAIPKIKYLCKILNRKFSIINTENEKNAVQNTIAPQDLRDLETQIKMCLNNLSLIPSSSETLLEYQLKTRQNVFLVIADDVELQFDKNTTAFILKTQKHANCLELYPPQCFELQLIELQDNEEFTIQSFRYNSHPFRIDLSKVSDKPILLRYRIKLIYFKEFDKQYELVSKRKQIQINNDMIKLLSSHKKKKMNVMLSLNQTIPYGGIDGEDEGWIYQQNRDGALIEINLWYFDKSINGIRLNTKKGGW
eukprot:58475_1